MKNKKRFFWGFWLTTIPFSLLMLFSAYNELASQEVGDFFIRLGFSNYAFRVELSIAKVLGVAALLLPVPARVKEWAYAGFTINLISALVAHISTGDSFDKYIWSIGFGVLLALSYFFRFQSESSHERIIKSN